jgi:hypothetical protein
MQPLPREAYCDIARLKNLSRLPLIPPTVEQQIPNFQRDGRHAAHDEAEALRDSFASYELYMRSHSAAAAFLKPPPQYLKRAAPDLSMCPPLMSSDILL